MITAEREIQLKIKIFILKNVKLNIYTYQLLTLLRRSFFF